MESATQIHKEERGALVAIFIVVLIFLIGGYFAWRDNISKLEEKRKQEASLEGSQYYESDLEYLGDETLNDITFDDTDFTTLDEGI